MTTSGSHRPARRRDAIRLVSLGIGLFCLCLVAPASAEGLEALYVLEDLLYLPIQYSALERGLLRDAADGVLDRFDLIQAGLIASGATDPVELFKYRRRFEHIRQHALLSIPYLVQTDQMAMEVFNYLHRNVLRRFEVHPVTVLDLHKDGSYNCITASWLYKVLSKRYDLPVTVIQTPVHAFIRLDTNPPIPIELTVPDHGFNLSQSREHILGVLLDSRLIRPRELDELGPDRVYSAYLTEQIPLTEVQIVSVLFYNRALSAFEAGNPALAFRNALAAHLTHPQDDRHTRLTRDVGLAYATALGEQGDGEGGDGIMAYLEGLSWPR